MLAKSLESLGMPPTNVIPIPPLTLYPILSDSFDTATVQVIVGQSNKAFTIHEGVLCNVAPYFCAAFEGNFIEGVRQVLELPEENETMFRRFQLWVYTKKLLEDDESFIGIDWKPLVDLYIFGDKYGIPDL